MLFVPLCCCDSQCEQHVAIQAETVLHKSATSPGFVPFCVCSISDMGEVAVLVLDGTMLVRSARMLMMLFFHCFPYQLKGKPVNMFLSGKIKLARCLSKQGYMHKTCFQDVAHHRHADNPTAHACAKLSAFCPVHLCLCKTSALGVRSKSGFKLKQ